MQNNKLYSILSHFNKYEQNRLRKYLLSPYFNKNQILVQLFEIIIDGINKDAEDAQLSREMIWQQILPDKIYDDVRFRKLSSDLLKLVESFLSQQIYDANPLHQATYLIEAVSRRRMEKLYKSSIRTARRLSNQQYHKPANFYFYQYQIERNYNDLQEKEFKRSERKNVEGIANNLDRFYLAEKLRYHCSVLSQQYFISHEYELLFIEEIIAHIKKYKYEDVPPIAVYYQIYLTHVETEDEAHYFKLKELLKQYGLQFPLNEAQVIYEHALNYCIRKINKGKRQFLEEYFILYESILNSEIIYVENELAPWHFKNIVVAALRLNKYDWTEQFILKYQDKLPETSRENAVTFNLARLYFYQKKYSNVIELLREVEYDDITYNLSSQAMLLITYYDTEEIEPLYSLMESFRTFLNRHKEIPPQRRKNYLNLIRFTKKLTKIIPGDKKATEKIKKEIELTSALVNSDWLKEKITELE